MEQAMELSPQALEQIGLYVRGNLGTWFREANLEREMDLRDRTLRVEEELKTQRELMREGFAQTEKRFEQIDKRFEDMQRSFEKRFEQVDKRFEDMQHNMDRRFDEVHRSIRSGQWFIGILVTFVMAASTAVQVLL
jgi:DNA anti-recombination protein RmuC